MYKKEKGFSLVELIVVIAIMAILVGAIVPNLMNQIEKARYSKDKAIVDSIATAVEEGIMEEYIYEDLVSIVDDFPCELTMKQIKTYSEQASGAKGKIFGTSVMESLKGGNVEFQSRGIKGKDVYEEDVVKISINEDLLITVSVEGAEKKLEVIK